MESKLIPYPVPYEYRYRLNILGFNCRMYRYTHGEDSKEHNQALKSLDNFVKVIRDNVGVENV